MRGRLGIAQQHHVVLDPSLAADHRKIAPHRTVGQQRVAFEEPAENLGHSIGRLLLAQALQPGALKGLRVGLEDPGRASDFVLIGMGDERAPLGLLENEGKGIERPGRAHPREHVGANIHFGLEVLDIFVAEAAVDAVGQHDEIGIGETGFVVDVGLEHQGHAEFARALLQDQEQLAARAAAEAIAADPMHRAAEMHRDIIPIGEFLGNAAIARRIVLFEIVQRGVGKYHAEAEGVVGAVALIDRDLGLRPLLPEQDRGVQTGRPAADDRDLHESLRPVPTFANYFKPKAFFRQARHCGSPDEAKRNPGFPGGLSPPGCAALHPGYAQRQLP